MTGKLKFRGKSRQNAENKQTFDLTAKIGINEKIRQNTENKQTFNLTAKIGVEGKTRQITENKQTFDLTPQTLKHYCVFHKIRFECVRDQCLILRIGRIHHSP